MQTFQRRKHSLTKPSICDANRNFRELTTSSQSLFTLDDAFIVAISLTEEEFNYCHTLASMTYQLIVAVSSLKLCVIPIINYIGTFIFSKI